MTDLSESLTRVSAYRTLPKPVSGPARNGDWLTRLLNDYYNRVEQGEMSGYPTQNVLSIHWNKGAVGHKILIRGMRSRDMRTGAAIRSLSEAHQQVINARYGLHRDLKGRPLTNVEKADALRIPLRTFEARLRAARKGLKKRLSASF